jgi:hypothetical protein
VAALVSVVVCLSQPFGLVGGAGVLAVLLACAGTAAGATTWVVDDDGGADVD